MRRPRLIAEQARNAHGLIGRFIAAIMAIETRRENLRAIEALGVEVGDRVLDVGCGPGRGLAELAARAPDGHVDAVDPSRLMVDVARRRNLRLVTAGHVTVATAGVDHLPFPDGSFDRILCVHVVYFWESLDIAFREIARVAKPGGRLALVFCTSADERAVKAFPSGIYRFPAMVEALAALKQAGVCVETIDPKPGEDSSRACLILARYLNIGVRH